MVVTLTAGRAGLIGSESTQMAQLRHFRGPARRAASCQQPRQSIARDVEGVHLLRELADGKREPR